MQTSMALFSFFFFINAVSRWSYLRLSANNFWGVKHNMFFLSIHYVNSAIITEHLVKSQGSLTTQMFSTFTHQGSAWLHLKIVTLLVQSWHYKPSAENVPGQKSRTLQRSFIFILKKNGKCKHNHAAVCTFFSVYKEDVGLWISFKVDIGWKCYKGSTRWNISNIIRSVACSPDSPVMWLGSVQANKERISCMYLSNNQSHAVASGLRVPICVRATLRGTWNPRESRAKRNLQEGFHQTCWRTAALCKVILREAVLCSVWHMTPFSENIP